MVRTHVSVSGPWVPSGVGQANIAEAKALMGSRLLAPSCLILVLLLDSQKEPAVLLIKKHQIRNGWMQAEPSTGPLAKAVKKLMFFSSDHYFPVPCLFLLLYFFCSLPLCSMPSSFSQATPSPQFADIHSVIH